MNACGYEEGTTAAAAAVAVAAAAVFMAAAAAASVAYMPPCGGAVGFVFEEEAVQTAGTSDHPPGAYSVETPSLSSSATASELSTGIGFSSLPRRAVGWCIALLVPCCDECAELGGYRNVALQMDDGTRRGRFATQCGSHDAVRTANKTGQDRKFALITLPPTPPQLEPSQNKRCFERSKDRKEPRPRFENLARMLIHSKRFGSMKLICAGSPECPPLV